MKKILFPILIALCVILGFQFTSPNEIKDTTDNIASSADGVILLELFTSQGCSSCPPADKLLDKALAENKNAIGLSYHVDYWNYIGWQDPFSTAEYTNYQRAYASKFKSESIYTPQLVVNGTSHFTGSDQAKLYKKTGSDDNYLPRSLTINNVKRENGNVKFTVNSEVEASLLTIALVIEKRNTEVSRGENRNRTLSNHNIVVARDVLTNTKGGAHTIRIPKLVKTSDKLKVIGYSQNQNLEVISAVQAKI